MRQAIDVLDLTHEVAALSRAPSVLEVARERMLVALVALLIARFELYGVDARAAAELDRLVLRSLFGRAGAA